MECCTRVTFVYYFIKVPSVHFDMELRPSLVHSSEEKSVRIFSLGNQNDDEAINKLTFTPFVKIIVNV